MDAKIHPKNYWGIRMEYKSFMEALKGKQHKIDKNKNNKIDAHDFELLRKEESELTEVSDQAKSLANDIVSKHKNMKVSVERGNVMIHHKDDDEKIDRLTLSHTGNNKFHLHRTGSSTEDHSYRNLTADEVHKHAAKHIGGLQESEELDEIRRMKTKLDSLDPVSAKSVARQKLSNLVKSGHGKGALIANKMRTLNMGDDLDQEDLDALYEVLSKDADAGDYISDFVHSTNPKFEGKSKKERINMALGAYYNTQKKKDGVSEGYYEKPASAYRRKGDEIKDPTPVAPVPDRKYIKGTPENKAYKATKKPINGMPTNMNKEETEQINEISKSTLGSYVNKASKDARYSGQIAKDFEHKAQKARNPGMKDAAKSLAASFKSKAWKRDDGIEKAVSRLTKEEVELNEADHRTLASLGRMHPNMAKHMTKGHEMDFYAQGSGDKISGVVKHNNGKEVHIQANKDGKLGKGLMHKFKVSSLEEATDTVTKDASGKVISFKHEGDWKKTTKADAKKDPAGKVSNMAGQAMQKMKNMSEAKDEQEYGYEGDMALNQLSTLIRCAEMIKDILKPDTDLPEWVQSKITLASDYIVTAADYLHSEMNEAVDTSPIKVKVQVAGKEAEEEKWMSAKKKSVKESFDDEGNLIPTKISYKDFITEIKLADLPVRKIQGHSYGANYSDPEGADDYDDKKPMKPAAEKRGRGRPAGAKSGARKIMGTSKLTNK